jgi:hypothetical protein
MSNKLSKSVEDNLNRAGRPKGVGNKSTGMAREAIARFVDGNANKMEEWLQSVAYGIQATDKEGHPKFSTEGNPIYVVPPNPEKAFGMLQSVMEYHLPKLARTEHSGDEDQPVKIIHEHKFLD